MMRPIQRRPSIADAVDLMMNMGVVQWCPALAALGVGEGAAPGRTVGLFLGPKQEAPANRVGRRRINPILAVKLTLGRTLRKHCFFSPTFHTWQSSVLQQ
jgi:hypothetical protein